MAKTLPRALGAAIATVPTQNREEASRQAAALFAQITTGGSDTEGASSATFAIDMVTRMDKFFTDMERQRIEAMSKVELIDRKIAGGTDTPIDVFNKTKLQEFLGASANLVDPKTLFGRLELLQSSRAYPANSLVKLDLANKISNQC